MDRTHLRKPPVAAPPRRTSPSGRAPAATPASARFLAVVGHEIRAPLSAALIHMHLAELKIVAGPPGPEHPAREALATARDELLRVQRLVGRVIELEQLGHAVIHSDRVDAAEIVRRAVRRATLHGSGLSVILDPFPVTLMGRWDGDALDQILENLL